jgi:hypothetical protein
MGYGKKAFIALMALGFTLSAVTAFAQSAREAVLALKELQERRESGISYRDYRNAIADAKSPVNLFAQSADAKKYPELMDSMNKVMAHYEYAGNLWNNKMTSRDAQFIEVNSDLGRDITRLYPEAARDILGGRHYYSVDLVLPVIWAQASTELDNTIKLYAKIEQDNEVNESKKENEKLKADAEIERLKAEIASLKKQLRSMKPKGNQ